MLNFRLILLTITFAYLTNLSHYLTVCMNVCLHNSLARSLPLPIKQIKQRLTDSRGR